MRQKVYLAGGMKSGWQEDLKELVGDNFIFFDPCKHNLSNPKEYSIWDSHFVKQCDILFAYMEYDNPSGIGLAYEIGLARGLGKTVILVDEKSLFNVPFEGEFSIVSNCVDNYFTDIRYAAEYLKTFSFYE